MKCRVEGNERFVLNFRAGITGGARRRHRCLYAEPQLTVATGKWSPSKLAVGGSCDCTGSLTSSWWERILSGNRNEEGFLGVGEVLQGFVSFALEGKQPSGFLEVHLAHQIALLFIKAAILQS